MLLHLSALSPSSSTFDPFRRKQSSRAFFVSGHAQHLKERSVSSSSVMSIQVARTLGAVGGWGCSGWDARF